MSKLRLHRAKIIATAIEMADERDLDAATLRGIAARLGVHVTSLYNHLPTKEAVLDEMVEALVAEAKFPTGSLTWQDWVRQFASALRALAHSHPGAFEVFHYRTAQGERAAETFEAAFAAFRRGGFDTYSSYSAVKATIVAVLGLVLEDMARVRDPGRRTDLSRVPAERFPHIHEVDRVAAQADTFGYLIDALIHGFAASPRRSKTRPGKARI